MQLKNQVSARRGVRAVSGDVVSAARQALAPWSAARIESLEPRRLLSAVLENSGAALAAVAAGLQMHADATVTTPATVKTDKADYMVGQVAVITGSGFTAGETVRLQVLRLPTSANPKQDAPWTVKANSKGAITSSYTITTADAHENLQLTAYGQTSKKSASYFFADAAASTTKLTASANPATYGQSVTFTATVTSGTTGTVTFKDGSTTLGTATLNGSSVATFTDAALSVATHSIVASYGGNTLYKASTSSTLSESVKAASTTTKVTSSATGTSGTTPLRPSHVVVVVLEDRAAGAIGDNTDFPYLNTVAANGLVFNNSHGLNTSAQDGEMNYLALYSGSTQGVTDDGGNYTFSGSNIAQSLNNTAGDSFAGYAESLPSAGDTTDAYVAEPGNPAYDDLYMRAYNPMAQFTNDGTAVANSAVNLPFSSFPTTASGYASLPSVSYVIPNTLDNTHGSNDTTPYATDPSEYDYLRQNADAWLKQNISGYLQWAKANNSLLIITDDEGDRAHNFAAGFATVVNGSTNLFVPGTDTTSITQYSILRTLEDMYGVTRLGQSATTPGLDVTASGKLGATTSITVGQPATFSATVAAVAPGAGTPTGKLQFEIDGVKSGAAVSLSSGVASASLTFTTAGAHTVTAVYAGVTDYLTSTSPVLSETIIVSGATTTLTSSAASTVSGQSITLTSTVAATAPGAGSPTGTVTFSDGTTTLGTVALTSDTASLTVSTLAVGTQSITASYNGDANFAASVSLAQSESVSQASTTVSLSTSATAPTFGQNVTFTAVVAAVSPGGGIPTGSVTFEDGATLLGVISLDPTGTASLSLTTLAVGANSITGSYGGDGNFIAAASLAVSVQVAPTSTPTAPPAPTDVAASIATFTDGIHVNWNASAGAASYQIWRSITSSSADAQPLNTAPITGTTYDDTTALIGVPYWYWVTATNTAGTSGFSASAPGTLEAPNDNFASGTVVSGSSVSVTGNSVGATREAGEPLITGNEGGHSVWWTWTAATTGNVQIDTHGSSFDTILGVYTGNTVSTLTLVPNGANDDDWAAGLSTSKVVIAVTAGTVYHIAVDGYNGVYGNVVVNINYTS